MRIRIVECLHFKGEEFGDISRFIGQEFDVVDSDDEGVYVECNGLPYYLIYHDEYEVVTGAKEELAEDYEEFVEEEVNAVHGLVGVRRIWILLSD